MRKLTDLKVLATLAVVLLVFIASCKKEEDEGAEPIITFRTGASSIPGKNYTSASSTIKAGDTCIVGIKAYKAEAVDVLKSFTIIRSETGQTDATVLTQTLTTAQQDTFYTEYQYVVASPAGKVQNFKFTVYNRDNIDGNANLTITSN